MRGFARNVASLAGGGVVAQAISLLAMPLLTRLYSAEDFGAFVTFMSVALVLGPFSTLRFNSALLVVDKEKRARYLLVLSLLSVITVAVVAGGVVTGAYMAGLSGALGPWLLLLPIAILAIGCMQSFQSYTFRRKQFGTAALAQVGESVSDRGIAIASALVTGSTIAGLLMARITGSTVNALYLGSKLLHLLGWRFFTESLKPRILRLVAWRYRFFPLVSSWAFLANSAARESPVILLAMIYGAVPAGLYGLGLRVLNVPILMAGDAVAKVALSRLREEVGNIEALKVFMLRLYGAVLYLVVPLAIIVLFRGRELFAFVFGEGWMQAGLYAALLSPVIVFMLAYRVSSGLFDLFERQRARLVFDLGLLCARVVSLSVAGWLLGGGVELSLFVMMVAVSAIYSIAIRYLFRAVGVSVRELWWVTLRQCGFMLPFLMVCMLFWWGDVAGGRLLALLVGALALQYLVILIFDKQSSFKALLK